MKKYLTLLLLSLLPLAASAYDAKIDGIYYNLNKSANTASVTYKELDNENPVNDCTGDIVVPDEVTYEDVTYKVTAIEEKAFYNCGGLTSAIIPNSVKSIGSYAFYGCENLTSVNIPDGIMTIRDNTFYGCHNLVTMFIPYGVKTIGSSAFYECQALNSVYIPNSVTLIGNYSFQKCSGLTSVIIPNSVTYLGRYAYADCISLNFVSLGSGIETFADHVFSGCESLSLVHNLAETPVSAGDDVFDDAAKITLYFPKGSHPKYSTKDPWRIFNDWTIDAAHGKTPHTLTIAINGETYDTYTLLNGATIMLSDPYKEGHSFEGWLNTIPEMQDYDFTYNAIFTPNKYKLTYKIDGETVYSDDIAFGTNLTQDSPYSVPAKEGYKFSGWQGLPEKMPAHDLTVTAGWTAREYTITFDDLRNRIRRHHHA